MLCEKKIKLVTLTIFMLILFMPVEVQASDEIVTFYEINYYGVRIGPDIDRIVIGGIDNWGADITAPYERYTKPNYVVKSAFLEDIYVIADGPINVSGLRIDVTLELGSFEDSFVYNDMIIGQNETIVFHQYFNRTDYEEATLSFGTDSSLMTTENFEIGVWIGTKWTLVVEELPDYVIIIVVSSSIIFCIGIIYKWRMNK